MNLHKQQQVSVADQKNMAKNRFAKYRPAIFEENRGKTRLLTQILPV
jgi:hypothetical protein